MKPLRELDATYQGNDISDLVEFIKVAPIHLPEDQKYIFEKKDAEVHVYGTAAGIDEYKVQALNDVLNGPEETSVSKTGAGIEIRLAGHDEVSTVVLHTSTQTSQQPAGRQSRSNGRSRGYAGESRPSSESSESRYSGESRGYSTGESRNSGESRSTGESRQSRSGGESRNSGESRQSGESRSPKRRRTRGESSGGCGER